MSFCFFNSLIDLSFCLGTIVILLICGTDDATVGLRPPSPENSFNSHCDATQSQAITFLFATLSSRLLRVDRLFSGVSTNSRIFPFPPPFLERNLNKLFPDLFLIFVSWYFEGKTFHQGATPRQQDENLLVNVELITDTYMAIICQYDTFWSIWSRGGSKLASVTKLS